MGVTARKFASCKQVSTTRSSRIRRRTGVYLLRNQAKSPNRLVGGKRFFPYNGISTDKAATFDVIRYGDGLIGFKMTAESSDEQAA